MLLSLNVKNLALIENAEVNFGEGLNVFTGETGAGKSLVIGSVNMSLGGRVKSDMLRDSEKDAEVEMVFSVEDPAILENLKEMDLLSEDENIVIIRRKITGRGSSAKVNGRTVTNSELKSLSSLLIDVHAQSEHQSLLYEKNHLSFLDRYAGADVTEALESYRERYDAWRSLSEELESMDKDEAERKREEDLLLFEVSEIEGADLKSGEDESLEERFKLMNNSKRISEAAGEAFNYISSENDGAASSLSRALRTLSAVSEFDKKAEELCSELGDAEALVNDFLRDLDSYISDLEFSPEEYEEVTKRLDLINNLKMKYGRTIEDILDSLKEKEERLNVLQNFDSHLNELKIKTEKAYNEMEAKADRLSALRKEAAIAMGRDMEQSLKDLNFLDSRFEVCVEDLPSFGTEGKDRVYFKISTNPGEEMKPLKDVASGGELSRIMLSLKTVLADMDDIGTMIFDEIDTGISGRTAQKVSESLIKLSKDHQVILITHLPQIAAMADSHFLIEKNVEEGRTRTDIHSLDREDMINELGRMLSGESLTDAVMENAREMKDLADKKKSGS